MEKVRFLKYTVSQWKNREQRGHATLMTNWELARYLIDAKKCVDSIMYIEKNLVALKNIGVREKVDSKRREFYINCCIILDKVFPKKKKELCSTDTIVQRLYYERDKNFAHKDLDYKPVEYVSLSEMVKDLQNQIVHLKELCKGVLPDAITLDFVPHDKELFRFVNGLLLQGKRRRLMKESIHCGKIMWVSKRENLFKYFMIQSKLEV